MSRAAVEGCTFYIMCIIEMTKGLFATIFKSSVVDVTFFLLAQSQTWQTKYGQDYLLKITDHYIWAETSPLLHQHHPSIRLKTGLGFMLITPQIPRCNMCDDVRV